MKTNLLKLALCAFVAVLPIGAWAADKTNVTGFEMWTFDQYLPNQSITAVTNYGQLYLRGSSIGGHGVTMKSSTVLDVTFNYGSKNKFKVGSYGYFPGNTYATSITTQIKDNFVARNAIGNASDRSFALDAGVAGTVHMWVRADNVTGADGKKICAAVSNGSNGSSSDYALSSDVHTFSSTETNPFEITFDVESGKSYMFLSESAFRLYAVAFVPTDYDFSNSTSSARRRVSFDDGASSVYSYVTFMTDYPCVLDSKRFKAYYASASNGSTVTLTEYSGNTLAANTPVILKYLGYDTNKDIIMKLSDSQGTIISPKDNLMKPVYSDTYQLPATYDTYTNYILAKESDSYVFAPSSGNGYINNWYIVKSSSNYLNVGKAYLAISGAAARSLEFVFDDSETTGIHAVNEVNPYTLVDYYDLQGRRVAQPTKGLYIVNGKKVMVK